MNQPLYFHEDDYCMVELLPVAEAPRCAAQMAEIDAFSAAHQTGAGWTEMYVRDEPAPPPLAALRLPVRAWLTSLQPPVVFYSAVATGYGSYTEPAPACVGWAAPEGVRLFAEVTDGLLQRAWLSFDNLTEAGVAGSQAALRGLTGADQLLLADWGWSELVPVTDDAHLLTYLQSRV